MLNFVFGEQTSCSVSLTHPTPPLHPIAFALIGVQRFGASELVSSAGAVEFAAFLRLRSLDLPSFRARGMVGVQSFTRGAKSLCVEVHAVRTVENWVAVAEQPHLARPREMSHLNTCAWNFHYKRGLNISLLLMNFPAAVCLRVVAVLQ